MSIVPDRELVYENEHKKIKIEENKDHSWSYFRDLLPVELKYIIHESLDYESLKSLCGVDKSWSKICGTDLGKKIMRKKYIEMVHKEFDRSRTMYNLLEKISGFGPTIKDIPGAEYVGIDENGNTTTDIAIMWYEKPKYCMHIIENGFNEDWNGKKHEVKNIEDVIAIHNALDKYEEVPNFCKAVNNPFLYVGRFSKYVGDIIDHLRFHNEKHKKIPNESIESLKNNPMDPCAWKRPSIRKAIKEYLPRVTYKEIMDAIFPGELDQARAKYTIRFR